MPEGVGGPEAGSIDLIYSYLLQEYNCDFYDHIHINQIGDDLQEMIMKVGKKIVTNINYPSNGFENKTIKEKNQIRLDIVHTALVRIAEKEKKLNINNLERFEIVLLNRILNLIFYTNSMRTKRISSWEKYLFIITRIGFIFIFLQKWIIRHWEKY